MTYHSNPLVIGVAHHDNDFYQTWTTLLAALQFRFGNKLPSLSKEQLVKSINEAIGGFYRIGQNSFEYNVEEEERDPNNIPKYLAISDKNLLLGEAEVDAYLSTTTWSNGETFILDTRIPDYNQQIYSV